ncbi:MAG TPA: D-Ala-D-Ala carboxypeptidase family metallohydrolase [Sphingomicrobium sp.]|nr:D-Ala-D-Ala carboxypeptidase family metallohydrolase [Sphingomicrobium sp.]
MMRAGIALIFLMSGTAAAGADTNWGIREIGGSPTVADEPAPAGTWALGTSPGRAVDMGSIKQIGSKWGQVTSTYRSPSHNRRVGGVANSYHLSNRAIDIARRPGVSHSQIAAAFRNAGYSLAESLDEGDHSHFAFGPPKRRGSRVQAQMVEVKSGEKTEWRIVYAPPSSSAASGGN